MDPGDTSSEDLIQRLCKSPLGLKLPGCPPRCSPPPTCSSAALRTLPHLRYTGIKSLLLGHLTTIGYPGLQTRLQLFQPEPQCWPKDSGPSWPSLPCCSGLRHPWDRVPVSPIPTLKIPTQIQFSASLMHTQLTCTSEKPSVTTLCVLHTNLWGDPANPPPRAQTQVQPTSPPLSTYISRLPGWTPPWSWPLSLFLGLHGAEQWGYGEGPVQPQAQQ